MPQPPPGFFDGPEDAAPLPPPWEALVTPATPEWFSTKPAARRWLLRDARRPDGDGVLPLGKVGQLVAEGGAGKTMLLMQLAIAVATGTRLFGALDVAAPGRVLLALGEEDVEEAQRRAYRARRSMGAPIPAPDSLVVLPLAGVACALIESDENRNPRETLFGAWLRAWVVANGPWSFIGLDPLSRFGGTEAETDNAAGTRYIQALEAIAATGPTVLSSHHTNKLSRGKGGRVEAHGARGSTSLIDGSRWVAALTREDLPHDDADTRERLGEIVTLSFAKSNYSRRGEPIALRYDADNGGALVPLDETDQETVEAARGGAAGRATKAAQRQAERDQGQTQRKQREAEQRAAREAAREQKVRQRNADDDAAARAAVEAHPDAPVRDLVALIRRSRACSQERAHAAVVRTRRST